MTTIAKIIFGVLMFFLCTTPTFFVCLLIVDKANKSLLETLFMAGTCAGVSCIGFLIFIGLAQTHWFDQQEKNIDELFEESNL